MALALYSGYHHSLPCLGAIGGARILTDAGVLRCQILAAQMLVRRFKNT